MAKAKSYTVTYERDETAWWVAGVRGVPGCHTQGRTIAQARERIRDALTDYIGPTAAAVELVDEVKLPGRAQTRVRKARATRERAEGLHAEAQAALREAVRVLTKDVGVSVRDASELLGISHQRVHQLAHRAGAAILR